MSTEFLRGELTGDEAALAASLSEDEWADLEGATREVIADPAGRHLAPDELRRLVVDCGWVYVDARIAGLCREGALECFATALREHQPAPT